MEAPSPGWSRLWAGGPGNTKAFPSTHWRALSRSHRTFPGPVNWVKPAQSGQAAKQVTWSSALCN